MKKGLLVLGSVLFVASMAISCGNKNAETTEEEIVAEEEVVEEATEAPAAEATAEVAVNKEEILSKAREAGQAKCNCYQTDPASVESCIKAILDQTYAAYQNDEDFQKEMKAEYDRCVKEKANAAAKKAVDAGTKEAAKAISKKLNNK